MRSPSSQPTRTPPRHRPQPPPPSTPHLQPPLTLTPVLPTHHLLQVKPPICMTEGEADRMVDAIGAVLDELTPEDFRRLAQASREEVAALQPQRSML